MSSNKDSGHSGFHGAPRDSARIAAFWCLAICAIRDSNNPGPHRAAADASQRGTPGWAGPDVVRVPGPGAQRRDRPTRAADLRPRPCASPTWMPDPAPLPRPAHSLRVGRAPPGRPCVSAGPTLAVSAARVLACGAARPPRPGLRRRSPGGFHAACESRPAGGRPVVILALLFCSVRQPGFASRRTGADCGESAGLANGQGLG